MTARNSPPRNVFETLRRLLACNKAQLAARLGVSARTLRRWEELDSAGEHPGTDAAARLAQLMQATLRAADADTYALPLDFARIDRIAGRR